MGKALGLKDDVLAWMAANGAGASEAARHFKLPVGTVTSWVNRARLALGRRGEAPPPPSKPAPPPLPPREPIEIGELETDPVAWWRSQLVMLTAAAREPSKEQAALARAAFRAREKYDELTAPKPGEIPSDEDVSTEVILQGVLDLIDEMPLSALDAVDRASAERRERLGAPMAQTR